MENEQELLNAVDTLQNEYDAYMMMNRYSWEEGKNDCAKEFKLLIKLLKGADFEDGLALNALLWIHDCYDCYYRDRIMSDEDNAFNYLRGVIKNGTD